MTGNNDKADHSLKMINFDTNKDSDDEYVVQGISYIILLHDTIRQ